MGFDRAQSVLGAEKYFRNSAGCSALCSLMWDCRRIVRMCRVCVEEVGCSNCQGCGTAERSRRHTAPALGPSRDLWRFVWSHSLIELAGAVG